MMMNSMKQMEEYSIKDEDEEEDFDEDENVDAEDDVHDNTMTATKKGPALSPVKMFGGALRVMNETVNHEGRNGVTHR